MKTTRRMAAGIVLRRLLIIIAVLLLLLIGKPVANRVTFAGATVGSFEIDLHARFIISIRVRLADSPNAIRTGRSAKIVGRTPVR